MVDELIKRDLLGLTIEEALAIYYNRCQDSSMKDVAETTEDRKNSMPKMSPGTVSNRAVQGLRHLRIDELKSGSDHCRILTELVGLLGNPPDWTKWPPEVPISEPSENIDKTPQPPVPSSQTESIAPTEPLQPPENIEEPSPSPVPPSQTEPIPPTEPASRFPISRRNIFNGLLLLALLFGLWLIIRTLGGENIIIGESPQVTAQEGTEEALDLSAVIVNRQATASHQGTAVAATLTAGFTPPPTTDSQGESETQVAQTVSAVQTNYVTDTPIPTPTVTSTPTPTNTPTLAPTPTPSNFQVTNGVLSDDRVSFTLDEVDYNHLSKVGLQSMTYAVAFDFTFKNNSGEEILLGILAEDITIIGDNGATFGCNFPIGKNTISRVVPNGGSTQVVVGCGGRASVDTQTKTLILTIKNLSSLPDSDWIVTVPR